MSGSNSLHMCACSGCGHVIRDEPHVFCVCPSSGSISSAGCCGSVSATSAAQSTGGPSLGDTMETEFTSASHDAARLVEKRAEESSGDRNRAALQQTSYWHERCLRCAECACALVDQSRCYASDRRLLCPQDYLRFAHCIYCTYINHSFIHSPTS